METKATTWLVNYILIDPEDAIIKSIIKTSSYIYKSIFAGVAIGAGWQTVVAYVNIACYYLFGVPLGLILGFKLDLGVLVSSSPSNRALILFELYIYAFDI